MKENDDAPIVMTEEFWASTHLSVVRYTGAISFQGYDYVVCDQYGHTIFEASVIAHKEGRAMAIQPGEPCDLVRKGAVLAYRILGRERMIELLKEGKNLKQINVEAKHVQKIREDEKRARKSEAKSAGAPSDGHGPNLFDEMP